MNRPSADTLVIQSHNKAAARRGWIAACLDSVRYWAERQGFDYAFHGDEALDLAPDWYRKKAGSKLPVVTDYVRLVLMQDALAAGYDRAIWFDADTLVYAPGRLTVEDSRSHLFGVECWVAPARGDGRLEVRRKVHNAALMFSLGDPVLPFLLHATESVIRRADPGRIAPQMVGPKLVTALHSIAEFSLWPEAGAFSPEILRDIAAGGGPALSLLKRESDVPPAAANLCHSLLDETGEEIVDAAARRLLEQGDLP